MQIGDASGHWRHVHTDLLAAHYLSGEGEDIRLFDYGYLSSLSTLQSSDGPVAWADSISDGDSIILSVQLIDDAGQLWDEVRAQISFAQGRPSAELVPQSDPEKDLLLAHGMSVALDRSGRAWVEWKGVAPGEQRIWGFSIDFYTADYQLLGTGHGWYKLASDVPNASRRVLVRHTLEGAHDRCPPPSFARIRSDWEVVLRYRDEADWPWWRGDWIIPVVLRD